jgi:serine/threonine protein kinase/Flp pilus assembly protein TadD
MDGERWERVKELFEAARERDEPERSPFLEQACAHDPELRREVESLLSGDKNAGDFLQEPVAHVSPGALANDHPPPAFSPDEIISGRFKILRFIGRGGMGEVYDARDLERKVRVALKTIRPEIASDPKTLARFNKEIDLALQVTHHNVCRVYHLERHRPPVASGKPEVVFLTMELLDGETLADRLRRQGRISCEEALPIIRQMAEGLAAAHKEHVVHCDFKPGNVMLVSERPADVDSLQSTQAVNVNCTRPAKPANGTHEASGGSAEATVTTEGANVAAPPPIATPRAVITDFGLARAMRPMLTRATIQESLDSGNHLVGTLPYMAPEQLEGHAAITASDVYALGLVVYEMVTGRQPFSGVTPLSAIYKRLEAVPPRPRTVVRGLDAGLDSVVMRCLERDPGARYANAGEIVAALGQFDLGLTNKWRIRRPLRWSAAVALSVPFLAGLLIAINPRAKEAARNYLFPPAIPSRKNLVVLPFRAADAPPGDQARCDGLTETVTAELAQTASLQVASSEFVHEHHIDDIKKARSQFGANLALSASWQHVGGSVRINLNLVDTETGQTLRSDTVDGAVGNVFSLQDQVVLHFLKMLQVQFSKDERKDLTTHGTEVLTAYDFYLQGVGYLQNYEKPESVDLGIDLFQRAISEDATYAQAYAGLAQAYLYKYNATREPHWAEQAKVAVRTAESLNSRLPDVQLAIGYLNQRTGAYEEALRALNRAIELDPDNVEAYQHLGQVYDLLGRTEEAEQAFRSATAIRPACWSCYNELGIFLNDHNRFGEAAQAWQKVIELAPDNPWGYTNFGTIYLYLGEFERAEEVFHRGLNLAPEDPNTAANAATAAFFLGRYEEDVHYCQMAIALRPQQYSYRGDLGDAYRMIPGESNKAASAYREAITLAEKQLEINPKDVETLSRLALYQARTGEGAQAQQNLAAALKIGRSDWSILEVACLIYLEEGDRPGAFKWLELAVRAGYPRGMLVADPELASLRSDPEFASLAAKAKTYQ